MASNQLLCRLALIAGRFWDFIDRRAIDKHVMAWAVFAITVHLMIWSAHFAVTSTRSGTDIAAILAALWAPWNLVQAGVVAWYFKARTAP